MVRRGVWEPWKTGKEPDGVWCIARWAHGRQAAAVGKVRRAAAVREQLGTYPRISSAPRKAQVCTDDHRMENARFLAPELAPLGMLGRAVTQGYTYGMRLLDAT